MNPKTDTPSVPDGIRTKIQQLHDLLEDAQGIYDEIFDWYDQELKSYDPSADASMELFDPGTGCVVEGISYHVVMDGLCILQTANESDRD